MYKKQSNVPKYVVAVIIMVMIGYYFGVLAGYCIVDGTVSLTKLSEGIDIISQNPLIWDWNRYSVPCIGITLLCGAMWILYDATLPNNYRHNREYGSVKWGNAKKICKKLKDKDPNNNRILSANVRISYNTRLTDLNNNGVVVGGSGSHKSFGYVSPNLYNSNTSFVVTDPKGELLARHGSHLRKKGYNVKVLNLLNPDNGDRYNPFVYIRSVEDIHKLSHNFIENTSDKKASRGDAFWTDSAEALFAAVCLYVWMEVSEPNKNMVTVTDLLGKMKISDEGIPSELDLIMESLPEEHPARISYEKANAGAADTIRSILATLNSRMRSLNTDKIKRMLSADDINIAELGIGQNGDQESRTAVFLVIPDNDTTFNYLVGLFYTQMFQELYYQADMVFGGRLPVPVSIWMDEFANVSLPDSFANLESTMRSREIYVQVILQNLSQIKSLFKDTWETILGNADTFVLLGCSEPTTLEYVSKRLGNETIDKKSDSQSRGKSGSTSISHDHMQRSLMTPDEISRMDKRKCIVFIRGELPIFDDKYNTVKDKIFMAFGNKRYVHPVSIKRDRMGNIISSNVAPLSKIVPLSQNSLEYYQNAESAGDKVVVYDITAEDLMAFDSKKLTLEIRNQYFHPEEKESKKTKVNPYLQQGRKEQDTKHQLLNSIIMNMSADQQQQILLGFNHGLTEEEISLYADPNLSVKMMQMKRELIENLRKGA